MPFERSRWLRGIKSVESEFLTVRVGVDWMISASPDDIHEIAEANGYADPPEGSRAEASRQLEATYLIRMFSIFEGALKSLRRSTVGSQDCQVSASELIDEVANLLPQRPSVDVINGAHRVRLLRNNLVHGGMAHHASRVILVDCRKDLLAFLDKMPQKSG